jgi:hypothetical protein
MEGFDDLMKLVGKPIPDHSEESVGSLLSLWKIVVYDDDRKQIADNWEIELSDKQYQELKTSLEKFDTSIICTVPLLGSYECSAELMLFHNQDTKSGWAYSPFDNEWTPIHPLPKLDEDLLLQLVLDHIGVSNAVFESSGDFSEIDWGSTLNIVDLQSEEESCSFYLDTSLFSEEKLLPFVRGLYRQAEQSELERWNLPPTAEEWLKKH